MAVSTSSRPNLGSGSIKFIDGFPFDGIGSAGFDDDDLLIIGDELDNTLQGGAGHDEIDGGAGNDIIKGGDGNGILRGDAGDDDLDGQEGTEKLFGGEGNDILRAGGSKPVIIEIKSDGTKERIQGDFDRLTGGDGNDTFGFYGFGSFEVTDFTVDQDRLFFDSEILGIHSFNELAPHITNIIDNGDSGFTAEFLGGAASIEIVGVNLDSFTLDMIVFHL